jgi:two-component system OmpR family sensor kinase
MATVDEMIRQDSDEVLHQLDRLHHLAGRLLSIERLETTPGLNLKLIDAQSLITRIARRWSAAVTRHWIVVDGPSAFIHADEHQLTDALDAIVENALKFTELDDIVRFTARVSGPWVVFDVADSGPGIPEAHRAKVFDRFYHRPPQGSEPGTGLGLALVAAVAGAHGGHARVSSAAEGGALVSMRIPAVSSMSPLSEETGEKPGQGDPDQARQPVRETPVHGSSAG